MTAQTLDELDGCILSALADDGRMSLKELAARVGLSSPSASERPRLLEERGVIRAFSLDIELEALGYALQAMARIRPCPASFTPCNG